MYDRFYSIMLDYSQLRHRVPDHTIFEICRHELIAIRQAINNILQNMIYFTVNDERNIEILREKIDRFEDIYQNVLRVTARDPIAFVLFIDSLKMFGRTK
ncbi:MAG: hypothetical protein A3F42_08410 [Gammaproteobacteria bacterium RIFCSPHIGHO2_12_FULL_37_34]|nr:MAG: hypothetical protein A3F42_08410 [Gammaproteobacteria bacterium RIFCSPHIGHO2_12_FULL_37_34]